MRATMMGALNAGITEISLRLSLEELHSRSHATTTTLRKRSAHTPQTEHRFSVHDPDPSNAEIALISYDLPHVPGWES